MRGRVQGGAQAYSGGRAAPSSLLPAMVAKKRIAKKRIAKKRMTIVRMPIERPTGKAQLQPLAEAAKSEVEGAGPPVRAGSGGETPRTTREGRSDFTRLSHCHQHCVWETREYNVP